MRVTVLAGGIGGARFLTGVLAQLGESAEVTVVANTGDDIRLWGLQVCPDLDSIMYTLGGGISRERGWGREDESFVVKEELAAYGAGPDWFGLGDRDTATHLVRTQMLAAGYPLSAVTEALCARWRPGVRLLPMTDERVETHVVVDGEEPGTRRAIHFQEWWIRHRATLPAYEITLIGAEDARPAPGVLQALGEADVVLLAPSNPVVSIGTILSVPGIRDAVRTTPAPVVGVSPIVGGAPVRGMADACLTAVGIPTSARAVAEHYGPRTVAGHDNAPTAAGVDGARNQGILDGWLVHDGSAGHAGDTDALAPLEAAGITTRAVPLLMTDPTTTQALATAALTLARSLPARG